MKTLTKECPICFIEFKYPRNQRHRKYCGYPCSWVAQKKIHKENIEDNITPREWRQMWTLFHGGKLDLKTILDKMTTKYTNLKAPNFD